LRSEGNVKKAHAEEPWRIALGIYVTMPFRPDGRDSSVISRMVQDAG